MKLLIGEAYAVHDFQVSGGSKWIDSDRYDVEAKADGDVPPSKKQLRAMLQNLLADRFGLTVRHETSEMPVYLLETGKGGSRLQRATQPTPIPGLINRGITGTDSWQSLDLLFGT